MLQVFSGKSREITKIARRDGALYLEAEAGLMRIWPKDKGIIRISYTDEPDFGKEQGKELADLSGPCDWSYEKEGEEIRLSTDQLTVTVNQRTGSIRFWEKQGKLLLAERERESKEIERFEVFRTVINESTQVEEVKTADGVKRRIRQSDRESAGFRCHTRLFLKFEEKEHLHGLGQAEEGVWNLRGTTQYLHQANRKIAVPVLLSDRGYGIAFSTQSPAIFSDTQYGSYFYTEADEYLDYYFLAGDADQVVKGYRRLTGKAALLPRWAFGYIQSKERYETAQELLRTAARFREQGIGLDALVLDWMSWKGNLWGQKTFDQERFPDPASMISSLHEMDVHFMLSIWPNMSRECDNFREFQEKDMLLAGTDIYDAFRADAREVYWQQVSRGLFCHGVDAWWCDSSEPFTPEWGKSRKPLPEKMYQDYVETASGSAPIEKANAYGYYHACGIWEGQRGCSEKRVVNLTRNGYLGSQKYGTILWSGDVAADWETLKNQIAAGLNFCASGLPYWTLDIGAFFVKKGEPWYWDGAFAGGAQDPGYRELYTRWLQYGAFLPIFRSHGTDCAREPWNFGGEGEPFYDAIVKAIRLRYRLLPYIYSLAGQAYFEDGTIMRGLNFDFPQDQTAAELADQYLFGPALMVCPVTQPMYYLPGGEVLEKAERSRKVWLPEGTDWYDFWTDEKYEGGQWVEAQAPIDRIPLFVRSGAVIPMVSEDIRCARESAERDIVLRVYGGADGTFTLYEDAGDGYGYEEGQYCLTHIIYKEETGEVSWRSEGNMEFRRGGLRVEKAGNLSLTGHCDKIKQ